MNIIKCLEQGQVAIFKTILKNLTVSFLRKEYKYHAGKQKGRQRNYHYAYFGCMFQHLRNVF